MCLATRAVAVTDIIDTMSLVLMLFHMVLYLEGKVEGDKRER